MQTTIRSFKINAIDDQLRELNVNLHCIQDPTRLALDLPNRKNKCDLWSYIWSTSSILGDLLYCNDLSSYCCSRRVLEIGSGSGLCSLVCGHCRANVTLTDACVEALDLCKLSISDNQLDSLIQTKLLSWHCLTSLEPDLIYDMIIGSDVLFVGCNVHPVIHTINRLLSPTGIALIIDPGRASSETFADTFRGQSSFSVIELSGENIALTSGGGESRSVVRLVRLFVIYGQNCDDIVNRITLLWNLLVDRRTRESGDSTFVIH